VTTGGAGLDKNWIACDNTPTSPFFGNCYTEWDDPVIHVNTSTDGGLTWGPAIATAGSATGIGGQPVVQPNGTVIVPIVSGGISAFRSIDGGNSWSAPTTIAPGSFHSDAGMRSPGLPSAEIDGGGKVYVVWPDCSFVAGCAANDIVMSTSTDGITWSAVARIPIDATTSGVDHFIPGIGVDPATSDGTAHLGLTYYFFPVSNCTLATCALNVGFISSVTGGATWGAPKTLAGPMSLNWLPDSGGKMVGDYISTSFAGGTAHSFFTVATANTGTVFNQALFTATNSVP